MAFFTKTYTSNYFNRLRQKSNYNKLAKLLKHEDISVATMAEEALQELINSEDEKEYRTGLYEAYPASYDKIIKRLEAAQLSNHNLNVEPIVRVFVQEREPLRMKKQVELEKISNLGNLLTEVGVTHLSNKNIRDLQALLEPNELIECALDEGSRGTYIPCYDFSLYTNKKMYILSGLADHEDWGTVDPIRYDAFNHMEETGVFAKKYEVSGKLDDVFAFTVDRDHPLIKRLGTYGTEEVKSDLRQLGLLEAEAESRQLGLLEEESTAQHD